MTFPTNLQRNENMLPPTRHLYIGMAVAALSSRAAPIALPLFRPNRRQGYRQAIRWRLFQVIGSGVKYRNGPVERNFLAGSPKHKREGLYMWRV